MIKSLIDKIPYWVAHGIIALVIAAVTGTIMTLMGITFAPYIGLAIGAGFYSLREMYQWRVLKLPFDWPGLIAPNVACAIAAILVAMI